MKGRLSSLVGACLVSVVTVAVVAATARTQQPAPTLPDLIPYQTKGTSGSKLWGYADPSGRLVIPAQFEKAELFGPEGLAEIKRDGRWGMIDRQGNEVIPARFSYQLPGELVGVCAKTDEVIPGITVLGPKPGQQTPVMRSKCGYLDRQGKVAVPFEYDWIHPFREGVAPVAVDRTSARCPGGRLYGLVDTKGKLVVQPEYCHIGLSEDGWLRVVFETRGINDEGIGFIDREGRVLLPKLPYETVAEGWRDAVLLVQAKNLRGFIDRKGREVATLRYEEVEHAAEGRVPVKLGGKWGFMDTSGNVVVPFEYEQVSGFSEGLACVKGGERSGFIDLTGKLVFKPPVDRDWGCRWSFSEGLRPTSQGDKWGYIDRTGKLVIPPQFDEAWGFSEGLAAVRKDDLWGFIDRSGAVVIPPRYFRVDRVFANGLAFVTVRVEAPGGKGMFFNFSEGYITRQGREFFEKP